MEHFPIFLNLQARRALILGGGPLAARKAALIAKGGAELTVVAESFSAAMRALARDEARVQLREARFTPHDLDGVALVLAAGDDQALNERVYALCSERGIPVNVADQPALCSYILPAIVDRSPVVVAVSTGGRSPVLARYVKLLLERALPQRLGQLAELLARWRRPVAEAIADGEQRRRFWQRTVEAAAAPMWRGDAEEADHTIARQLERDGAEQLRGEVALIGAPTDDPEWLSIKAHRTIQRAEWVFCDGDTPAALLELARREAHCVNADHHSADDCRQMIARQVARGQSVVRLYGRDPELCREGGDDHRALEALDLAPLALPATRAPQPETAVRPARPLYTAA